MTKQINLEQAAQLSDAAYAETQKAFDIMSRAERSAISPKLCEGARRTYETAVRRQQEAYRLWYEAREAVGE